RLAALHQAAGGGALLRGDEVERAALVVLAPAAPIAELLEHALHVGGAEPGCAGPHRPLPDWFVRRPAIQGVRLAVRGSASARMSRCLSQLISTLRLIPPSRCARGYGRD